MYLDLAEVTDTVLASNIELMFLKRRLFDDPNAVAKSEFDTWFTSWDRNLGRWLQPLTANTSMHLTEPFSYSTLRICRFLSSAILTLSARLCYGRNASTEASPWSYQTFFVTQSKSISDGRFGTSISGCPRLHDNMPVQVDASLCTSVHAQAYISADLIRCSPGPPARTCKLTAIIFCFVLIFSFPEGYS